MQSKTEEKNVKPLKIIFSNLVEQGKDKYSINLLKDSVNIPYSIEWDSPMVLIFYLMKIGNLRPIMNYNY